MLGYFSWPRIKNLGWDVTREAENARKQNEQKEHNTFHEHPATFAGHCPWDYAENTEFFLLPATTTANVLLLYTDNKI